MCIRKPKLQDLFKQNKAQFTLVQQHRLLDQESPGSKIQRNSLCPRCWNFTLLEYFLQGNVECRKTIFTTCNWIMSLIQSLHTSTMRNWINDTTDTFTAHKTPYHVLQIFFQLNIYILWTTHHLYIWNKQLDKCICTDLYIKAWLQNNHTYAYLSYPKFLVLNLSEGNWCSCVGMRVEHGNSRILSFTSDQHVTELVQQL